jgi:hypothetical protein
MVARRSMKWRKQEMMLYPGCLLSTVYCLDAAGTLPRPMGSAKVNCHNVREESIAGIFRVFSARVFLEEGRGVGSSVSAADVGHGAGIRESLGRWRDNGEAEGPIAQTSAT